MQAQGTHESAAHNKAGKDARKMQAYERWMLEMAELDVLCLSTDELAQA